MAVFYYSTFVILVHGYYQTFPISVSTVKENVNKKLGQIVMERSVYGRHRVFLPKTKEYYQKGRESKEYTTIC
jgi:hypothetical protein